MAFDGSAPGGCWPTRDQVILLRAAVGEGDDALDAWLRWRATNDPAATDRGSVRLLPLVFRNLSPDTLDDADRTTLKSSYQAAWYRNQLNLKSVADALRVLHDAGIRTMLLKGTALVVAHYGDAGVRPMEDADVLVPWEDAHRARAALTNAGWQAADSGADVSGLEGAHAEHLRHPRGGHVDLHRTALVPASPDRPFWDASVEVELLGVRTRVLCASDQLLHVAAHGARWNMVPPLRWMADAVVVERSAGHELDWDRFVAEATRRRLTLLLAAALEHLVDAVGFALPGTVFERLRSVRSSPLERLTFRAATKPFGGGTAAPLLFDQYRRLSRLDPSLRLRDVLRVGLGAPTRRDLAGILARKAAEVAVFQSARAAAPHRLEACKRCGRQIVRLRPSRPPLCHRCAAAAS